MIHLSNITKQHGSQVLFREASFQILPGTRTGLVGPNGAGKTSLFRIITGEEEVDAGEITLAKKTTIGYFSQDVGEMSGRSALEEVMAVSAETVRLAGELKQMEEQMGLPMSDSDMEALLARYGTAMEEFEHRGGYDLDSRAQEVLTGLGIGPDRFHNPVESFSGGWRMRVALAGILTLQPDVLLLDEPTNHLDVESIIWLEEWIATEFKGALLMTSHDRDFMNRVVTRIIEVANKTRHHLRRQLRLLREERDIRREQLLASYKRQQEMLAKEEEFIARFAARASHAAQVQSRVKKIEKIERIEIPPEEKVVKFNFNDPPRSGDDVVAMDGLGKSWTNPDGSVHPVFSGVSGVIKRLSKIAVVGVNGAGKSTFLKVMAGETEPTAGSVRAGRQRGARLLQPARHGDPRPEEDHLRDAAGRDPARHHRRDQEPARLLPVPGRRRRQEDREPLRRREEQGGPGDAPGAAGELPGAGRADQPPGHQVARDPAGRLANFAGTVMLVSHDRHFLRLLVDRVIEVDHGEMRLYEGNYDYYLSKTHHSIH